MAKYQFNTQTDKILKLVIHSLYENKEIFLRELISNAADALEKLRYLSQQDANLIPQGYRGKIQVRINQDAGTITISDNGIGMNESDLKENLGTIAKSGTEEFFTNMENAKDVKDAKSLIGQFGVGFYSAFMVADEISVTSRKAGESDSFFWKSSGEGEFEIKPAENPQSEPGTKIVIHLKQSEKEEFTNKFTIKNIIKTYSNHISFPIEFFETSKQDNSVGGGSADGATIDAVVDGGNGDGGAEQDKSNANAQQEEPEQINSGKAIWRKAKKEVTQEEYSEFYKNVNGFTLDEPFLTIHYNAEGVINYYSLLFIPTKPPFDLFHPDRKTNVKLYAKQVFVAEKDLDVVPAHLRFVRGVIDCDDLPLNISREAVQNNMVIEKLRKTIVKKVTSELAKLQKKDASKYEEFWGNFGSVIKEGLCEHLHLDAKDELLEICLFYSLNQDKLITLKEYKENLKENQKEIYFLTSDNLSEAKKNPKLEGFKERGLDVLLLTDNVDDFWVTVLHEYQSVALKSVTMADVSLDASTNGDDATDSEQAIKDDAGKENSKENAKADVLSENDDLLINYIKQVLGENIKNVVFSKKLSVSPVCLTTPEGAMDSRLERFMIDNKQIAEAAAKILEINRSHPIIKKLGQDIAKIPEDASLAKTAESRIWLLFDQANIIEGEKPKSPSDFIARLNDLMQEAS